MAIWPFGRKGKRPRSQMKASDAAERRLSFPEAESSPIASKGEEARKPSRKRSKRERNYHRHTPSEGFSGESEVPNPNHFAYSFENQTSLSSIVQENFTVARPTPMLQKRASGASRGTLTKRLSKRSARELAREREIKAMSSSPPSERPLRVATWNYPPGDIGRGPSAQSRHTDRHTSNQSLPMQESSRSSLSEASDSYTFKVNALAVFTPRPIIRYADAPKYHVPRSQNPSAESMRREVKPWDEEDMHSTKRVAELADELDAPALRELLDRDRRRREKKRLEDQERLQRRVQRRIERQRLEEQQSASKGKVEAVRVDLEDLRGRDRTPSPTTSTSHAPHEETQDTVETQDQSGSWLRGPSKESARRRSNRLSDVSAHVIGNIDDRSIRGSAHDVIPTSAPQSPARPAHASTGVSHVPPGAHESFSDLSRTGDSERRISDTPKRMGTWRSLFRRTSPRKRDSGELAPGPPSDFSNTSRESFARAPSRLASGPSVPTPAIPIPERSFLRSGTIHRSQSKFTEHLGDFPISPPDSRIQSPVPIGLETVPDDSPVSYRDDELTAGLSPRSLADHEVGPEHSSRPLSWDASSRGTGPDSGLLSQSLASIDSEGSWMSGKYLRRISQNTANSTLRSGSTKNKLDRYQETKEADDVTSDEYFHHLADQSPEHRHSVAELRRASSTAMGLEEVDSDDSPSPASLDKAASTKWHEGVARRPTVVRQGVARPKSKEGLLHDVEMLDSSENSPISQRDEESVEIQRAQSIDLGRGMRHARHISAGSAKLLDIPRRSSVESKGLESEPIATSQP
jgi:hypothetical protein